MIDLLARELAGEGLDLWSHQRSPHTDEEWLQEIEQRAKRALAGEPGISWEEARRQFEKTLRAS